jgi:hypothetical protein
MLSLFQQVLTNPLRAFLDYPNTIVITILVILATVATVPIFKFLLKPPRKALTSESSLLQELLQIKRVPLTDSENIWELATSKKSVCVAEPGRVRVFESIHKEIKPKFVIAAITKATLAPDFPFTNILSKPEIKLEKPKTILLLDTHQMKQETVQKVKEELKSKMQIDLITETELNQNKELLEQYTKQVPATYQLSNEIPKRGCHVCHNDIPGKASQCSACKAIIYCSKECAVIINVFNIRKKIGQFIKIFARL